MQKIFFISIFLLIVCSWADKPDHKYTHDDFVRQFKKTYANSTEKGKHQGQFNQNMAEINKQNEKGAGLIPNNMTDWLPT